MRKVLSSSSAASLLPSTSLSLSLLDLPKSKKYYNGGSEIWTGRRISSYFDGVEEDDGGCGRGSERRR